MKLTAPPDFLTMDYETIDPAEHGRLMTACTSGESVEVWPGHAGTYFIANISQGKEAVQVILQRTKVQ